MRATDDGVAAAVNLLVSVCYQNAAHWYTDPVTGQLRSPAENGKALPQALMLIVSELVEAFEGYRRGNMMDDHLPHRPMRDAELADAFIRLCTTAGSLGIDLGEVVQEKLAYNAHRADHQAAARQAPGGKSF